MTTADGDMPGSGIDRPVSPIDREVTARLGAAAAWAGSFVWSFDAADAMAGRGVRQGVKRRSQSGAPIRLRPRVIWAVLVALAIAAAVVVPEISSQSNSSSGAGTTRTTVSSHNGSSHKGGGSQTHSSGTGCTTTVHGFGVSSKGLVVDLPISPGPIITRARAISVARAEVHAVTTHLVPPGGDAKLSSWTEVSELRYAGEPGIDIQGPGPGVEPWTPVWAVLVLMPGDKGGFGLPGPTWYLVVVNAANAEVVLEVQTGSAWFSSLSDRDPSLKGCPGGSSARVPFGVLTRDEDSYVVHRLQPPGTPVILILTTVNALNHADPGLYGGCTQVKCPLDELIWPLLEITRAAPGHTLACLPPSASYPPGYHPKQVTEYFVLAIGGNSEIGCGPVPAAISDLKDLAPPGN